MAEPPAHALASGQGSHSPPLGGLCWRHAERRRRMAWKESSARAEPAAGGWRRRCTVDGRDWPLAFGGRGFPLHPLAEVTMLKLPTSIAIDQSQRTCFIGRRRV